MKHPDALQARAKALHLHGLLAHWPEVVAAGWAQSLIDWEDEERARRSLERRPRARISVASNRYATSTGGGLPPSIAGPSRH